MSTQHGRLTTLASPSHGWGAPFETWGAIRWGQSATLAARASRREHSECSVDASVSRRWQLAALELAVMLPWGAASCLLADPRVAFGSRRARVGSARWLLAAARWSRTAEAAIAVAMTASNADVCVS